MKHTRREFIGCTIAAASLVPSIVARAEAAIRHHGSAASLDANVAKVLLVYNTSSTDSVAIMNYMVANRPGFANVAVLPITTIEEEITDSTTYTTTIEAPIVAALQANSNLTYVILCRGIPHRTAGGGSSVSYLISTSFSRLGILTGTEYYAFGLNATTTHYTRAAYPGTTALVTTMDMGSLAATTAYVDKVKAMYNAMATKSTIVSATNAGLGGVNYYIDGANGYFGVNLLLYDYSQLTENDGVSTGRITETLQTATVHISSGVNVLGYETWGTNAGMSDTYPDDGSIVFTGNSNWWLCKTVESFNGQVGTYQGGFEKFFAATCAGGTSYSATPIGMACHVEEPLTTGIEGASYLGNWELSWIFAECAWSSRQTPYFMVVGDPLVIK